MRDWMILPSERHRDVSMALIVAAVAKRFQVSPDALRGPRRTRGVVWPRHVAIWLCLLDGTRSSVQVGNYFLRDHTSILHAVKRIEGRAKRSKSRPEGEARLRQTAAELADELKIRRGFRTVVAVDDLSPVKQRPGDEISGARVMPINA